MRTKTVLMALFFAGCAPAWVRHELPSGYVELEERGAYLKRGVSAEGVALGLKVEKNRPKASAAFWSKVAERYLKEANGYVPLKAPLDLAVRARGWKVFKFSLPADEPLAYLLALRVSESEKRIDIVECAGPKKVVEADEKKLLRYLAALRRD